MRAPLVCLHGLAGSPRWWEPVADRIPGPVLVLDVPRDLRPDALTGWVEDTIEEAAPVDLAGHSLGALIAVRVAASRPELVRRLILIAPPGIRPWRSPLHLGAPLVATLLHARPRLLATFARDAVRSGPRNIFRGGMHVASADVTAELASVQAPTLLVWGARDRLVPASAGIAWQALLPRGRLVVLPNAAHVPMLESPEELRDEIVAFREEPIDAGGDEAGM
jgi:2-hydroxy-6-oxonona-2,4-dienedioate hydrolase